MPKLYQGTYGGIYYRKKGRKVYLNDRQKRGLSFGATVEVTVNEHFTDLVESRKRQTEATKEHEEGVRQKVYKSFKKYLRTPGLDLNKVIQVLDNIDKTTNGKWELHYLNRLLAIVYKILDTEGKSSELVALKKAADDAQYEQPKKHAAPKSKKMRKLQEMMEGAGVTTKLAPGQNTNIKEVRLKKLQEDYKKCMQTDPDGKSRKCIEIIKEYKEVFETTKSASSRETKKLGMDSFQGLLVQSGDNPLKATFMKELKALNMRGITDPNEIYNIIVTKNPTLKNLADQYLESNDVTKTLIQLNISNYKNAILELIPSSKELKLTSEQQDIFMELVKELTNAYLDPFDGLIQV